MLNQFNLETIQERCKKLASNYLTRALRVNPLIKDLVTFYNIAPKISEGLFLLINIAINENFEARKVIKDLIKLTKKDILYFKLDHENFGQI
ncbi:hypothetical protein BpHYR1_021058 [Brachionus plicatilis]|uniref:Uncharacterized protein n=1 Tax=Brachionus plicatilis TaxID=10195 RepID=A0A3M7PH71_BRAPC|nr:hypothetical protein BpHYR1_021058 [Brachionus plicatilis]